MPDYPTTPAVETNPPPNDPSVDAHLGTAPKHWPLETGALNETEPHPPVMIVTPEPG